MRPGDLVALKEGLFGLNPPDNLAIYLERKKRKKEFTVVVVTVRGLKEVKPQQVSGRRFRASVDPGLDEAQLVQRLKDLVGQAGRGDLKEEAASEAETPPEKAAWERVVAQGEGPYTVEAIARLLVEDEPSKGDLRRTQELLETCRRPGTGHFERAERGTWRPIPVDEMKAFHATMDALGRLRHRLVRIVMVEDDSGEPWETFQGVTPQEAGLDDDEHRLLEACAEAMGDYVLHDGFPDHTQAPGTRLNTLDGRSYGRFLTDLARDWTAAVGVTRSSTFVQFLVDTQLRSVQDAIRLVAQRRVRAAPGFAWTTPESVEERADRFDEPGLAAERDPELYRPRRDLRTLETYTIDPPDAKDFDDAVSIIARDDGGTDLWVHIADVSHYVEKDSLLDRHARERATSVYLPTGVLPMLPHRLSDDLCSLREGVDRLAMSVRIETDAEGRVTGWEPAEAVIRVDQNLAYDTVNEHIEAGREPFAALARLATRMQAHRRGLAIETGELRIRFAEEAAREAALREGLEAGTEAAAEATHIDPREDTGLTVQVKHGTVATKMIETFMVAANEAVSRFVADHDVAVPYRCHPLPERTKAERFEAQAQVLGLDVTLELPEPPGSEGAAAAEEDEDEVDEGPSILDQLKGGKLQLGGFAASETVGSAKEPSDADETVEDSGPLAPTIHGLAQLSEAERAAWLQPFRDVLAAVEAIEDPATRDLAYMKVLGTLGRALYTPRNLGHFGLGSPSYAHFTSPIRRYPDLVLHRQLRWVLRRQAGLDTDEQAPHAAVHLDELCQHCTEQSVEAERLERGLLSCCMTFESRREAWAGPVVAMVNGVAPGGIFLSLPGELEARLSMRDLPGGPYEVDEYGTMLFRARTLGARAPDDPDEEARLPLDWREMEDPTTGELREVRVRLGDKLQAQVRERDFVEGRVNVRLAGGL